MAVALVFNPGSNSLKFEAVEVDPHQKLASAATKLASAAIDDIGKGGKLSVYKGREVVTSEPADAPDMAAAASAALRWLKQALDSEQSGKPLSFVGVRVVHGGPHFNSAALVTPDLRARIEQLEELAPLHNQSSLTVLDVLGRDLPSVRALVTFDTAFHRTLPEVAWRYPIHRETADRHGIRKYGFHGLSHRFMLEQYAHAVGRSPGDINLVTLHLESGNSACAIQAGRSIDTTMGLTPLEGLMMGSRSGSIDPAIIPFLMHHEGKPVEDVMQLLNKQSGLLGIAGGTLDTRELVKRHDEPATLALAMYSYRVRLAVGAYLAALGNAEAVIFGGGIGEDSPWLRSEVCNGLSGWGLTLDPQANESVAGQVRISTSESRLHAWAMPVEEGLQIAHECMQALQSAHQPL